LSRQVLPPEVYGRWSRLGEALALHLFARRGGRACVMIAVISRVAGEPSHERLGQIDRVQPFAGVIPVDIFDSVRCHWHFSCIVIAGAGFSDRRPLYFCLTRRSSLATPISTSLPPAKARLMRSRSASASTASSTSVETETTKWCSFSPS